MIAKFTDLSNEQIMEVEKVSEGVGFYITQYGEESIAQSITLPLAEIPNLIKFLTETIVKSVQLHQ